MPLYLVEDSESYAYIKADNMNAAVEKWKKAMCKRHEFERMDDPDNIKIVCCDYELIVGDSFEA